MRKSEKIIVKLCPTGNLVPRSQEIRELYLLNRQHGQLSWFRALWFALRHEVTLRACDLIVIGNLGLKVDLDAAFREHELQLGA